MNLYNMQKKTWLLNNHKSYKVKKGDKDEK